jgi:YVTN family beta-propeller protein
MRTSGAKLQLSHRTSARTARLRRSAAVAAALLAATQIAGTCNTNNHEPVGFQLFASPQANPVALSPDGSMLFVAATTSNQVVVVDTSSNTVVIDIEVGIEPVGLGVRPDGLEVWVSNHVSDSVSVIDNDPTSGTYLEVIDTVQDLGPDGETLFDEPVGIAFASNAKAYVALSSRNQIAVVDVASRSVTGHIDVHAQEPRAITVRNGLLYVPSFESMNQTELSLCSGFTGTGGVGDQCSLGLTDLVNFATNPNLPGAVKNIVVDPQVPDRDLFVYDTVTDTEVDAVSGLGTLLYGIAVDSTGRAFISQTEARNAVNGDEGQNLVDLDNRIFLNQVSTTSCNAGGCGAASIFELEPLPPGQPALSDALATPYGIAVSGDDSTLVGTAAGTSRVFTLDPGTGAVQDILDLGSGADAGQQIPRGVALLSDGSGAPQTAYVLNTLENTVSVVDVSNPAALSETTEIPVGSDKTPDAVRRGRIAFNNAFASDTGTFSCASCHPDGNTDQLLWRIGGACTFGGCTGDDEPRTTMPVRGLRNTLPLHWDGTLGDPFGGGNGEVGSGGAGGTDCALGDADGDHDCFVDLVLASLSGVMCDQTGACPPGGNQLSAQERDDMAFFLASVSYPPARSRRPDDGLTAGAVAGFSDFFTDQGGAANDPNTCADSDAGCHELPLTGGTNSATLNGFDIPTMRGMTDRFIQFSIGPTGTEEILTLANAGFNFLIVADPLEPSIQWDPNVGYREETTFGAAFLLFQPAYNVRPLDIFQMFEEASTGFSGATGRQVTLNTATTGGGALADTEAILDQLELADQRGLVNLRARGRRDTGGGFANVLLSYRAGTGDYRNQNDTLTLTRADLIAEAQAGTLVATLTGALPRNFGSEDYRQPLLAPDGPGAGPTGDPGLPMDPGPGAPMDLTGIDVRSDAQILVDGVPAGGTIACLAGGSFTPYCDSQLVRITLDATPSGNGLHVVQIQNPSAPQSNELPVCVGAAGGCQ